MGTHTHTQFKRKSEIERNNEENLEA